MDTNLIFQLAQIDFDFGLTQATQAGSPLEPTLKLLYNRQGSDFRFLQLASIGLFLEQRDPNSYWPSERLQALEQWHSIFWQYLEANEIKRLKIDEQNDFIKAYHSALQSLGTPRYYDKSHSAFCRKIASVKSEKKAVAAREAKNKWVKNGKVKKGNENNNK